MMKYSFLLLSMYSLFQLCAIGQKVGVNKTNPVATFDVGGSINLDSNLTVKGIAGQEGQVLMAMGGNQMAWQHMDGFTGGGLFKNIRYYLTNGTFTIPTGVARVYVEAWGGGAGGTWHMGGGSGGYAAGFFNVSAGQEVTINIGAGGNGSPSFWGGAQAGGNTIVSLLSNTITAQGGESIVYSDTLSAYFNKVAGGNGGGYSFAGPATRMQFGSNGYPGQLVRYQPGNNNFVVINQGAGADTPFWPAATGGKGAFHYFGAFTDLFGSGSAGTRPGGGGGSEQVPGDSDVIKRGTNGGPGLVRISF
jgi:hypothetical protein